MAKRFLEWKYPAIVLHRASGVPLHRQITEALRSMIVLGGLLPGQRLPSTQALAAALRVSRSTVLAAYQGLAAEGYLAGRPGSAARVARALPDTYLRQLRRGVLPPRRAGLLRAARTARRPARAGVFDPFGLLSPAFDPGDSTR